MLTKRGFNDKNCNSRFDFINTKVNIVKSKRSTHICTQDNTSNLHSCKRSQVMQLPFGILFSIILIAVFVFVAFFAIKVFLEQRDCSQIGLFINDLQGEIDNVWMSSETSSGIFSAVLPSGIKYVCFADMEAAEGLSGDDDIIREIERYSSEKNLFFYPAKYSCNMPAQIIKHINITEITKYENPYCIENKKGRINMTIEKDYYEALVKIKRG